MELVLFGMLFLFGSSFGSFTSAFEYRLKNKIDFIKKRSMCEICKQTLAWYDLIPILSFLALKGRCRHCETKVSWLEPLFETLSGATFVFSGFFVINKIGPIVDLEDVFILLALSIFVGVIMELFLFFALYDAKYQIIPNKVVIPAIVLSFSLILLLEIFSFFYYSPALFDIFYKFSFLSNFMTGLFAGLFIFLIILLTKGKGMGGGDLKLVVLMGFILGSYKFILAFYIAILGGSVVGVGYAIYKKKFKGLKIPFGTFLSIGSTFAFLFGEPIIDRLLSILVISF